MPKRVVVTLDLTTEEAHAIAERIAGVGPYYEAWNLPVVLEQLEEMEGEVGTAYLRSDASAALGGPSVKVSKA